MTGPDQQTGGQPVPPAEPLAERLVTPLSRAAGAMSCLMILFALGLTLYAITLRYLFNRAPMWSDELLGYVLVALVMAGMTEAYRRNDHIAIDLLSARLSGRAAWLKQAWADLCVLVLAMILTHSAWVSASFSYRFGFYSIGPLEAPMWIPMVPVVLGFALLALLAMARLLGRLLKGAPT